MIRALFRTLLLLFLSIPNVIASQTLEAETTALAYASPHLNNQLESRYHLYFSRRSDPLADPLAQLQYGLSLDLWGLIPQDISDWVDVREAFAGLNFKNLNLQIGRILPDWAKQDIDSPLQKMFPKFTIDPLTHITDGIVGIYSHYQHSLLNIEFLYSPLFLPNRGGVRFEKGPDQRLGSISRWLPPLFNEVKVGDGVIPLDYALHLPAVKDILLRESGFIRFSLQTKAIQLTLVGADFFDPTPTLSYDAKLHIRDESLLQAMVHLYPEFSREQMLGFQSKTIWKNIELFNDGAYFNRESIFKNRTGIRIRTDHRFLSEWVAAALFSKHLKDTTNAPSPIPDRPEETLFSKISLNLWSASQFSFSYETDFSMKQKILRGSLSLGPFAQMQFGIGFDILSGEDHTYWGLFRGNDRIWLKGSYVF